MTTNDDSGWAYIKSLGLKPHVTSLEIFFDEVDRGMKNARSFLEDLGCGPFPPVFLRVIHAIVFENVFPWAGKFRNEVSLEAAAPEMCSPRERVVSDLETVTRGAQAWFKQPDLERVEAFSEKVAAFTIGFSQVGPFPGFNGPVAYLMFEHYVNALAEHHKAKTLLPHLMSEHVANARFLDACRDGMEGLGLSKLANLAIEFGGLNDIRRAQEVDSKIEKASPELSAAETILKALKSMGEAAQALDPKDKDKSRLN